MNPGGSAVDVTVGVGGAERVVSVPAAGAASITLVAEQGALLTGTSGLHASVSFAGDDELAAMGVQPPGPLDSPIRVYPR
jgi:hypothetical protein